MRLLGALSIAALAACAGSPQSLLAAFPDSVVFAYTDGVRLVAIPGVEFPINQVGLGAETARALGLAESIWGTPPGLLDGWTIAYNGGWFPCFTPEGATWTYGCTVPAAEVIYAAPDDSGCRSAVIVHEYGHAALGLRDHSDPRFAEATERGGEVCQ